MDLPRAGQVERADSLETKFNQFLNTGARSDADPAVAPSRPAGRQGCGRRIKPRRSGSAAATSVKAQLLALGCATRRVPIDRSPEARKTFGIADRALIQYARAIYRKRGDHNVEHRAEQAVQTTWDRFLASGRAARFDATACTLQMPFLLGMLRNVTHEVRRSDARSVASHLADRVRRGRDRGPGRPGQVLYVGGQVVAVAHRTMRDDRPLATVPSAGPQPWEAAATAEVVARVRAAIDALPPALAQGVRESFWGAAAGTALPSATRYVRLCRAKQRLWVALGSIAGH